MMKFVIEDDPPNHKIVTPSPTAGLNAPPETGPTANAPTTTVNPIASP